MIKLTDATIYIKGDVDGSIHDTLKSYVAHNDKRKEGFLVKAENVEDLSKIQYDIHLYCITPLYSGIDIYSEIIDSCYINPKGTIVFVNRIQYGYQFSSENLNNISKLCDHVNRITNRLSCILNDKKAIISFILELNVLDIKKESERISSGVLTKVYNSLKDRLPNEIFENQSIAENLSRIIYKYIIEHGTNSKGTT